MSVSEASTKSPPPPPRWPPQAGLTLPELMIAISLVVTVALMTATFLSRQKPLIRSLRASFAMQDLAQRAANAAANPDVLSFSARNFMLVDSDVLMRNNEMLLKCIDPRDPTDDCDVTDPARQLPIDLILPFNVETQAGTNEAKAARRTIAGGGNGEDPVRYRADGSRCVARDGTIPPDCIFTAEASFWATCPAGSESAQGTLVEFGNNVYPNANELDQKAKEIEANLQARSQPLNSLAPSRSCRRASTIHVRYRIHHDAEHDPDRRRRLRPLPDIPDTIAFNRNAAGPGGGDDPVFGALSTPVSAIPFGNDFEAPCAEGFSVVSVQDGKPKCACVFPNVLSLPRGDISPEAGRLEVCRANDNRCSAGQRFRGTYRYAGAGSEKQFCGNTYGREQDGSPICCPIKCELKSAEVAAGIPVGCGPGEWLESVSTVNLQREGDTGIGECEVEACDIAKDGGSCRPQVKKCNVIIRCCHEPDSYNAAP